MARRAGLAIPALAVSGALAAGAHVLRVEAGPAADAARVSGLEQELSGHVAAGAGQSGHGGAAGGTGATPGAAGGTGATPGRAATPGAAGPPTASPTGQRSAAACSSPAGTGGTGMLPRNYATIVSFLTAHGYTAIAAAGIAGNIYQESGGNPESVGSGGGGLIGFTPLPAGLVTGHPPADLRTQLEAILTYNRQWSAYLPALNAATTATQAAVIYMDDFERPGIPMAAHREAAARAVAQACGI